MNLKSQPLGVWAPIAAVNFGACAILYLQSNRFLMSGGSDLPNTIIGPSLAAQVLCVCLMLAASVAVLRLSRLWKITAALVWLILFLSAAHRVVIDVASREVRDAYALITVQRMPMGDWEGEVADLVVQRSWLQYELRAPGASGGAMTVFAGIPPGRLQMP